MYCFKCKKQSELEYLRTKINSLENDISELKSSNLEKDIKLLNLEKEIDALKTYCKNRTSNSFGKARRDASHKELSLEFYKTLYREWHNKEVTKMGLLRMFTEEDGVYTHLLEGRKMSKASMYNWYDYAEALHNNNWDMSDFANLRKQVDAKKSIK